MFLCFVRKDTFQFLMNTDINQAKSLLQNMIKNGSPQFFRHKFIEKQNLGLLTMSKPSENQNLNSLRETIKITYQNQQKSSCFSNKYKGSS